MKKNILNIIIVLLLGIIGIIVYLLIPNKEYKVSEITLNKYEIKMYIKEKNMIIPKVLPENANNKEITWESSNPNIATVNNNGVVSGISEGEAEIIASTIDKTVKATCKVKVMAVEVNGIIIDKDNIVMKEGNKDKINAIATPDNATYPQIEYKSSNEKIVKVDQNGNIEAIKEGFAEIIVTDINKKAEARCKITIKPKIVIIDVKDIKLNKSDFNITIGESDTLTATITPSNATNKEITWTSSDSSIVSIDNGKLIAKKTGTAIITASSNNKKTASVKVTVVSKTYNKTAIFIGDSITYGFSSGGYSWANYIGDNYDLKKTINAGLSSSALTTFRPGLWLVDHVKKYNASKYDNIDYVILQGGHNDVVGDRPLGTYSKDDFSGKYNTDTILGGLETYIYTVKKRWPNAKIGYILNYQMPRNQYVGKRGSDCYSAFKKVFDKWHVGYFDMYFGKAPNGKSYSDILKVNTTEYFADGTHINRKGYDVISPYIYDWMSNL